MDVIKNSLKIFVKVLAYLSYIFIALYAVVEIPILFGYRPLIVLSGSMEPSYKVGSLLYYHEVDKEDIKIDDVITFKIEEDKNVTHRVIAIEGEKYKTKGDANTVEDSWLINYSDIKGKVSKITIPYIGFYINFVNTHLYLIWVIVLILVSEFLLSNVEIFDINRKRGVRSNGKSKEE